jgi:hypothetical protein
MEEGLERPPPPPQRIVQRPHFNSRHSFGHDIRKPFDFNRLGGELDGHFSGKTLKYIAIVLQEN